MDAYTLHLLGLAVEACEGDFELCNRRDGWYADGTSTGYIPKPHANVVDALRALLDGLGVQYPERPSERQVDDAYLRVVPTPSGARSYALRVLRDLYAREPLTVLALLEGDR